MKIWLYCLLFTFNCFCPVLLAQPLGLDLLKNRDKIELPFELNHGFIMMKIKMNRTLPLDFIFDTGAQHTILFHKPYADLIGIEYSKRIKIIGSDLSEELFALVARNIQIDVGNVTGGIRDVLVLEENKMILEESIGVRLDGILGGSFFRGLVVEIDYKKRKIILHDPEKYVKKPKGFTEFPITIYNNKPYLNTKTYMISGDTVNTGLLLDTGAALPFLLHTNTDTSLIMPDNVILGNIGQGMGGIIFGFLGKINKLQLGKYEFNNILTSFQDIDLSLKSKESIMRNGIMGNLLLSRFHIIIDYMRARLYLKPKKNYNKGFGYDKSGLIVLAFGEKLNKFIVNSVIIGSPAHEADIRPGDTITKIGWWGSKHWTLDKINRKLQQKNGKCIKMTIDRDGQKIKKKFYLRDLLKTPLKSKPSQT